MGIFMAVLLQPRTRTRRRKW